MTHRERHATRIETLITTNSLLRKVIRILTSVSIEVIVLSKEEKSSTETETGRDAYEALKKGKMVVRARPAGQEPETPQPRSETQETESSK